MNVTVIMHESGLFEMYLEEVLLIFTSEELSKALRRGETCLRNRAAYAVKIREKTLPDKRLHGEHCE